MDIEPDFRPFAAADDGTRLVLRRRATVSAVLVRGALYLLLLLILSGFVLIPAAMWHATASGRTGPITSVIAAAALLPLNWLVLQLVLVGFELEGVQRIECRPDGLDLVRRGVVRRRHEHVRGVVALVARTVRQTTEYRDVRWLELSVRTGAGTTDLGHLALHPEAEATREAAARAAAGRIAARLRVPLELVDERGEPVA